jgi:acetate kinase
MGTRCGDVDSTVITYMMEVLKIGPKDIENIMNKKSGLLGISGVSSDLRDIESGINNGNERCVLAQKMFVRRIVDYIAKYYVLLGGCDAIVFTAGIGENSIMTRRDIISELGALGVELDSEANDVRGVERRVTTDNSKIPAYIIPTNEELMISRDTYNLTK